MAIGASVIADSISEAGKRITTLQLKYPRFIHSEFMTHRVFSRNASSSRAIPVARMIEQVRYDPAMPVHWGKNQAGMQAHEEIQHVKHAEDFWRMTAEKACQRAEYMVEIGLHKQVVNRILEPFQWMHTIVTATEFDNFFELRCHKDAQPEIQELAIQMKEAMYKSGPRILKYGEWHLPYITREDRRAANHGPSQTPEWGLLRNISAARCCRVSYLKHDGTVASIGEELALCDRLIGARPLHASPFEHQATPDIIVPGSRGQMAHWRRSDLHGNFTGWIQNRKLIESQLS